MGCAEGIERHGGSSNSLMINQHSSGNLHPEGLPASPAEDLIYFQSSLLAV